MIDVALLTQFVWENLQMAGSEISVAVWDKIKNAVGDTTFDKMQQYITNQEEDKFKQQLEIAFENQSLAEQLEQLRQSTNNHNIITNNFSNITTQGDFIAGNIVIK